MSVRARIIKVGVAKSVEMGIISLARFFSVPLFLSAWTPDLYGEWLILYTLISYFTLGGLGFGQAAGNQMTMALAAGDEARADRVYQTTWVIVLILSALLMALAALVAWLLPLNRWMNIALIPESSTDAIVFLFAGYVVLGFLTSPAMSAYRAVGMLHRGLFWTNGGQLLEFGAMALALALGAGTLGVAAAITASRLLLLAGLQLDQLLVVKRFRPCLRQASRQEFAALLSPALSFAAYPVGNTVINQGIVMAIGGIVGPVAVVLWSSLRTLTNLVTRLFDLVNQAFYPEVSMAFGAGNRELVRRLHRVSCQTSFWLGVLSAAGLLLLGPWLFRVWTHGKVELDMGLFLGFVALVVLRSLWYTSFVVPSAINQHQRLTLGYLFASVLGLGLSVGLLYLGLLPSLAGFALVEVAMTYLVIPKSLSLAQETLPALVAGVLTPPNPLAVARMALGRG
ncbi:MAG: hypothetical protein GYA21_09375 [Myxococcales bacterium]|nr:hypothetical protein [Myxococcales bacterium]